MISTGVLKRKKILQSQGCRTTEGHRRAQPTPAHFPTPQRTRSPPSAPSVCRGCLLSVPGEILPLGRACLNPAPPCWTRVTTGRVCFFFVYLRVYWVRLSICVYLESLGWMRAQLRRMCLTDVSAGSYWTTILVSGVWRKLCAVQ